MSVLKIKDNGVWKSIPTVASTIDDGTLTEDMFSDDLKLKSIKDYVTPQMFGAKGDGVTDDTSAILSMFASDHKDFFFPAGKYIVTDDITIDESDISICGAGMYVSEIFFDDSHGITINNPRITISDLKIAHANAVTTNTHHITFTKCWLYSGNIGLVLNEAYIVQVINCYITFNKIGIVANDQSFETVIDACVIDNNKIGVIITGNASGIIIQNSTIEGNYDRNDNIGCGVCLNYYAGTARISSCWFDQNGTSNDSCDIFFASQNYNSARLGTLYAKINNLYTLKDTSTTLCFGRVLIDSSKFNYTKYGVATAGYYNNAIIKDNVFSGSSGKNNVAVLFSTSANITTAGNQVHCADNSVVNTNSAITAEMLSGINNTYIYSDLVLNTKELQELASTTQYFSLNGMPLYTFDRFNKRVEVDNLAGSSSLAYTMNIYSNTAILYFTYDTLMLISCNNTATTAPVRSIYGTAPTVSTDSVNKTLTINVPAYRKAVLLISQ